MILRIRVVPRSGTSGFETVMADGCYKIRLKSPPVDGKANEELVRWLAGQFSVGRGDVAIISGASSRTKTVRIQGAGSAPPWCHG